MTNKDTGAVGLNFPISTYGEIEKFSDTISKARCRIFYKYKNRNKAYITDDFAEKLLETLPYTPVKGIFDVEDGDYTDHGQKRQEGRIYGVVPADPEVEWEDHLDEDGITRTYATCAVLLFTALYPEANIVSGKSESMELYPPSLKGKWQYIDGEKYYVYDAGGFLGLQILGDNTTPCFEGASFYSLTDMVDAISAAVSEYEKNNGGSEMSKLNFKLSDAEKHDALWSLLNENYNEENEWAVNASVCQVYDEYAICFDYETQTYFRAFYTKDDETNSVSIEKRESCFIVDVSEGEMNALKAIQAINGGTYEKIDEKFSSIETLENEKVELNQKIEECNNTISTLSTEKEELSAKVEDFSAQVAAKDTELATKVEEIASLTSEKETLESYKLARERADKKNLVSSYSAKLAEEIITEMSTDESVDKFSYDELKKELALKLVESNPQFFSLDDDNSFVPTPKDEDGLSAILRSYEKN